MRVLVIGDGIIDNYLHGTNNRMSPENQEVPIFDINKSEYRLGGAFNVATNIKSLSCGLRIYVSTCYISLFTFGLLSTKNIDPKLCGFSFRSLYEPEWNCELIKTRLFDLKTNKQVIRLDNQKKFHQDHVEQYHRLLEKLLEKFAFDVVVVSDYSKGTIDRWLINRLSKLNIPMFVDTKKTDFSIWPNRDNTFFKINFKEWSEAKNWKELKNLIVTRGSLPVFYYQNGEIVNRTNVEQIERPDVTGCGDVFLAALAVEYLEVKDINMSIDFATKAATVSATKFGTCEVKRSEI